MAKGKRTTTPLPQEPRERYITLANRRVNNAVKAIRAVGKLASRLNKYGENDVAEIGRVFALATDTTLNELTNHIKGVTKTMDAMFDASKPGPTEETE